MPIKLNHIEPKHAFKLPDNYFEGLEQSIMERITSPQGVLLSQIEKKNVFRVPEQYFEELPEKIIQKTVSTKQTSPFKISWSVPRVGRVASGIAIISGLFLMTITQKQGSIESQKLAKVNNAEIENYLIKQDLSYLDYENLAISAEEADSLGIEELNLSETEILKHVQEEI